MLLNAMGLIPITGCVRITRAQIMLFTSSHQDVIKGSVKQAGSRAREVGSKANIWPFRLSSASQIASYCEVIFPTIPQKIKVLPGTYM